MHRVIILFGFCTAGKSTILKDIKKRIERDNIQIIDKDTDAEISKKYNRHIYNIYMSFYEDYKDKYYKGIKIPECKNSKFNNKDANEYIDKKEREILVKLTDECFESNIPYIIAPGPFLVTRKPQWGYFRENIKPICYYFKLTAEEAFRGLICRRERQLKYSKIGKSASFGCWDDGSITKYEKGKYVLLSSEEALENIKRNMNEPCKIFEDLSGKNRTFLVEDIRKNYNDLMNKLYNSIKNDIQLPL